MLDRLQGILKQTRLHRAELTLIYLVQLLCYAVAAICTYSVIDKYIGSSSALDRLAGGFDRTVLMDVIYNNDGVFDGTKAMIVIVLAVYLLLSVVLHGGLLHNITTQSSSVKIMVHKGLSLFFPFLSISLIAISSLAVVAAMIVIPFLTWVGDPLVTFDSERPFVWWIIGLMVAFTLIILWVWAWMVCTKYAYLSGHSFFKSLRIGAITIWRQARQIFALGYLLMGLHVLIALISFLILRDRGAASWLVVIIGLLIRQVIVYLRIWIRGGAYSALFHIYNEAYHQNDRA